MLDDAGDNNSSKNTSQSSQGDIVNDTWLESQIICDRADITMANEDSGNEAAALSDYEYDKNEEEDLEDIDEMYSRQEAYEEDESRLDDDLDPEFRDAGNTECLQALAYDRAFVVNGPVIKVYKNGEDEDQSSDQQRLKYMMHLPVIRDNQGDVLEPMNMMLHNNESSMLFVDKKNKNRVVNYDLESGQIADEFDMGDKLGADGVAMIVNEFKNASNTASQLFQGISERNVFTLDPRLNSNSRIAAERPYKTNPLFSTIGASMSGNLALGSADGKIRLYKQVG